MLKNHINKYRNTKIKYQLISNVIVFSCLYITLVTILIISESTFNHSELIREKMFYILIGLPIAFILYAALKIFINRNSYYNNMTDESLAKELGDNIPSLSDKILNVLQLSKNDYKNKLQKELADYAIKEIDTDIKKYSLKFPIGKRLLLQLVSLAIISLVTITSIIIIKYIDPKKNINTSFYGPLARIFYFNETTPKPFKIKCIDCATNATAIAGDDIKIEFIIESTLLLPKELKLYSLTANKKDSVIIQLNDTNTINYTFSDIQKTTKYWAISESKSFFSNWDTVQSNSNIIRVIQRPEILDIEFEIIPPQYSNLTSQKYINLEPQIRALMNSVINYKIRSDQNLSSAIIISDITDTTLLSENNNYWNSSLLITKDHMQEIILTNLDGVDNQEKFKCKIKLLNDFNPELYVISPIDKIFAINNVSQIPLKFKLSDDYGLEESWIEYSIIKPDYIEIDSSIYSLPINKYQDNKSYTETYNWDLSEYDLFPGDQIKFQIVSKDNNPNDQGITKSKYYNAIYPSFEDVFTALEEDEKKIETASNDIINQIDNLDTVLEDIKLDLLKASDISLENQQKAEESIEKMDNIFSEIQKMEDVINELKEQAERDNIIDTDLTDKFEQFQELLNTMMTPELMEAMQKMQEALENMDLKQMLEAVENFDYNLEQFEKQLDRFIEMFELAIAEQKIDELAATLKLMAEKEQDIENKLNDEVSFKQLSSMQKRQNEKFDNLQKIMQEAKESVEKFSKKTSETLSELMNSDLNNETQKSLQAAENTLSNNERSAIDYVEESTQNLSEMSERAQNIQALFKEETTKEMIQLFYSVIDNILKLSKDQETLLVISKDTRLSSPKIKEHTFDQFIINKQFSKFIDQLMNLSTKTFYITPNINNKIGFCKKAINNSIINLEQRKISTAKQEQNKTLGSMNEIALLLISAMNEMQETGSASGLSSYLEELEEISQGQSELNMGTMQLGQMGMMQQGDMMKRLQAQQKALQEKLQQILDDMPGQNQGGLSKASEDMLDIIEDFKNNRVTKETTDKQNKILSRLLDSQKSLKEKEYSEERKGETGLEVDYSGPINLPDNLGQNNLLFMDAMEEALNEGYSEEYKKMFRKYYRDLLNNENEIK